MPVPASLYVPSSVLSLPSSDPCAVIAETWLRASGVAFHKIQKPQCSLSMVIPATSEEPRHAALGTLNEILCFISKETKREKAQIPDEMELLLRTVTEKCLVPAFTFLLYWDPVVYYSQVRFSNSLLHRVFCRNEAHRLEVLRRNVYSSDAAGAPTVVAGLDGAELKRAEKVMNEVLEVFGVLESICARRSGRDSGTYIDGTNTPSLLDAYVYGSISCFIHSDFASVQEQYPSQTALLCRIQKLIRDRCVELVAYAENVRCKLFEDQSSRYYLHPPVNELEEESGHDMYRRGRTKTIVSTVLFAAAYCFLSNISLFIDVEQLVQQLIETEEEEKEV